MSIDVAPAKANRRWVWLRVCRPLLLWLLLFLVAAGHKLHEYLLQQTRLVAAVSFQGKKSYEAVVTLDGKPYQFGDLVSLGSHTLTIRNPKAVSFQTNLFVWYGEHNLRGIDLKRTTGTLAISAMPAAEKLVIFGHEFDVTLTNSIGFTSSVPTDEYFVSANYKYWKRTEKVTVRADATATYGFAPKLGALQIEGSHPDIRYQLRNDKHELIEAGALPATIAGLPASDSYELIARRKEDWQTNAVSVTDGATNTVKVAFIYGAATIESDPAGATVLKAGRELGVTPLTLSELNTRSFEFSLRLAEYETVNGGIAITANATNAFHTNLISQHYTAAIASARQHFENKDYDRAIEAATEALKYKAGDEAAMKLQAESATMAHLSKSEAWGERGNFTNAIAEANLALATALENARAKELIAEYTNREQERLEAIRKHEEELAEQERQRREREAAERLAQVRTKELHEAFAIAERPYENASQFMSHELVVSNSAAVAGSAIETALTSEQPVFENVRLRWIYPHLFMLEGRQRVGVGYRDCLIVGSQVREDETRIQFKVFEYEHPPDLKLLGGMLQLSTGVTITSQDPKVVAEKAERFRVRVKEGVELVKGKIQKPTD